MIKKIKYYLIFLALFISGCIDVPEEFVTPRWDVELFVPIAEKTYTLQDVIDKDTTFLRVSDNPDEPNLLLYRYYERFPSVKLAENLLFDSFIDTISQAIGPIPLGEIEPLFRDVYADEWANVTHEEEQIFPETEGQLRISFGNIDEFEFVSIESGQLEIFIQNKLPVPLYIYYLGLYDEEKQSAVIESELSILLQPGEKYKTNYDLSGRGFSDSLVFLSDIYTRGSEDSVFVEDDSGISVNASFRDLFAHYLSAPLREGKNFLIQNSIVFGDSITFSSLVFSGGNFEIKIKNSVPVNLNIELNIPGLHKPDGSVYGKNFDLNIDQEIIWQEADLSGWILTNDSPTEDLYFSLNIKTEPGEDLINISSTDQIEINFKFDDLSVGSISGSVPQLEFSVNNTLVNLDYGDFNTNFSFDKFLLKNPSIELQFFSSFDIEVQFDGSLFFNNRFQEQNFLLEQFIIPPSGSVTYKLDEKDLSSTLGNFSLNLPDKIGLRGDGIINPSGTLGGISLSDSIGGRINIDFPFNVSLSNGEFRDTFKIDFGNISREDILQINYGTIGIEISNAIPMDMALHAYTLDSDKITVLTIPPNPLSDGKSELIIESPQINESGEALSATL